MTKVCYKCKLELPVTAFSKHLKKKDGLQTACKTCKKLMDKVLYQQNPKRQQQRNTLNKKKYKEQIDLIKANSGCKYCDEKEPCCLDFHHIGHKTSQISKMRQNGLTKTLEEIKKCVVVCANCHRKLHAGIMDV